MVAFKQQNPKLKVIASIGGWNFPSSFFSEAVKQENRPKFI
jgi:GH18 family chitinase